jgi:hypothetical protein
MIGFFCLIMLFLIFDRIFLRRADISRIAIGELIYTSDSVRIPLLYTTKFARLNGAKVEYSLRDAKHPTTVISGRARTLIHSQKGQNSEYLIVNDKFLSDGQWILSVQVLHGDSFFNPLYRIFPITQIVEKSFTIHLKKRGEV